MMAANSVRAGEHKAIVAGGMESMTNAPQLLMGQRRGAKMGDSTLVDSMIHDGLWDVYNDVHMGTTGETIANECAIDRRTMDAFAARSQQRAAEAWENGWFDWETFPVEIPQRRGDPVVLSTDEGVRSDTTEESLADLRPVFDQQETPARSTTAPALFSLPTRRMPRRTVGKSSPPSKITAPRGLSQSA